MMIEPLLNLKAAGPARLLRRPAAARYCGVSVSKFDQLVRAEDMPGGHWIGGCLVWDMRELDPAIDALLYGAEPSAVGGEGYDAEWDD